MILRNDRIALDVDSPEDLFRLLDAGPAGHTSRVLEAFHLERRR